MKLQSLTIIFIIIILPIIILLSSYIGYEIDVINKQNMYNSGVMQATHDAIFAFELNTKNDSYSNNAESKRSNIKAAIKTFENSLSTTCNLGLYNNEAIEEYMPAIVFGLHDGFYMYAPSELTTTRPDGTTETTYKHNLRNYVYYSEQIDGTDIVIRHSLDNYVVVSGNFEGVYHTKSGYLIELDNCENYSKSYDNSKKEYTVTLDSEFKYNGAIIKDNENLKYQELKDDGTIETNGGETNNKSARKYYKEALEFTLWFQRNVGDILTDSKYDYLDFAEADGKNNDPDSESSLFTQHKRTIMKDKIEEVLNSSITAYDSRVGNINYKMPKFSAEEWEKIYSNISVIALVQGMDLGFKNYNGYCILNSTNSQEYVNSNLMYFVDGAGNYHDIRCSTVTSSSDLTGYRIGDFETTKYEAVKVDNAGNPVKDANGDDIMETKYYYKHNEYACYGCINGNSSLNSGSVQGYITDSSTSSEVKTAYYTSLARERNKTTKLQDDVYNAPSSETGVYSLKVIFHENYGSDITTTVTITAGSGNKIEKPSPDPNRAGYLFNGWSTSKFDNGIYYTFGSEVTNSLVLNYSGELNLYAQWEKVYTVEFLIDADGPVELVKKYENVPAEEILKNYISNLDKQTINQNVLNKENDTYKFKEWKYTDKDANLKTFNSIDEMNTQLKNWNALDTISIYAKYKKYYKIIYNENYGDTPYEETVTGLEANQYGEYTIKEENVIKEPRERAAYAFRGWYYDPTCVNPLNIGDKISSNVTVYAKWEEMPKVIFFANGDYAKFIDNNSDTMTKYVIKGTKLKEITGIDVERVDYTFKGWSENQYGIGILDLETPIDSDKTLYAVWERITYTVNIDPNGGKFADGTTIPKYRTIYSGDILKETDVPIVSKVGYGFVGWYTDTAGNNIYDFSKPVRSNITLYAKWLKCNVQFIVNGTPYKTVTVPYNGKVSRPTDPSETGHGFNGWYTDSACTELFDFENTNITTNPTKLYGKLTKHKYTVTYNANGGAFSDLSSTYNVPNIEYGTNYTIANKAPIRTNYKFECWNTKPDGTGTDYYAGNSITIKNNTTLYAQWILTQFNVSFKVETIWDWGLIDKSAELTFDVGISGNLHITREYGGARR